MESDRGARTDRGPPVYRRAPPKGGHRAPPYYKAVHTPGVPQGAPLYPIDRVMSRVELVHSLPGARGAHAKWGSPDLAVRRGSGSLSLFEVVG